MGTLLLLACDFRIGARGPFRKGRNGAAIADEHALRRLL